MATYAECLAIVQESLGEYLKPEQSPDEDQALTGDLEMSSLQIFELVVELEDRLDISLPLNDLPDVKTVRELAQLLESTSGGG